MNYLAHIYLSQCARQCIVGAVLGDFVKGRQFSEYPDSIRTAISLHRAIDRYTDSHPVIKQSYALVKPERRRFAGILTDIFFDHFLAKLWTSYHRLPLQEFESNVYNTLQQYTGPKPSQFENLVTHMSRQRWLHAYARMDGIERAVHGIYRRLQHHSKAKVLLGAGEELRDHYDEFENLFKQFFPAVVAFSRATASTGVNNTPTTR